jgi:hypothetical protein
MKLEGWWIAKIKQWGSPIWKYVMHLTPGKKYLIYKNKFGFPEFINDKDKRVVLNNEEDMNWNDFFETFESIEHWRDSQLKKIGI